MFETILAPMDGSKLAEQAIPYVTELAMQYNSGVTLMGVCEPGEIEACRLSINKQVGDIQKAVQQSQATVEPVVLTGHPAQQIVDFAVKNNIGLIVLTSHGRSGLAPWSLGSTVQKIMHLKSRVPVLLVKANENPRQCNGLFGRIVIPLDGSSRGEAAIPYVVELTKKFESDVILFHAVEEGRHLHNIGGLDYLSFPEQEIVREKETAEKYLAATGENFNGTKAKITRQVRVGDAAREILKLTSGQEGCLIALSSHGHTGIDAWTYGSITNKIVQAAAQPLLLVSAV